MTAGLAEAERRVIALRAQIESEKSRHAAALQRLSTELEKAADDRDLVLAGVPLATVEVAESLIYVRGREHALAGDGPTVIRKAIVDLASGCNNLRVRYFGTKDYDRWHGQAESGSYGSGPAHGTKMLEIGLVKRYRARHESGGQPFVGQPEQPAEAQVDAAIAYLHAVAREAAR